MIEIIGESGLAALGANVRGGMLRLFALCAVSALVDMVLDGNRLARAVQIACGLSIALCVVDMLSGII